MNKKSKNVLLLVVLIAIIGIAVGYAALSQTLVLNGTATVKAGDWDVHFSRGEKTENSELGFVDATMSADSGTTGTFAATLQPGGWVTFEVDIVNGGTIGAVKQAASVTDPATVEGVTCTVTDKGDNSTVLTKDNNNVHTYEVTLACADMDELPEEDIEAEFEVNFDYLQQTNPGN